MKFDYDYVDWTCDNCRTNLNSQPGFSTSLGRWYCTVCGYENDVTDDNILPGAEFFPGGSDGYIFEKTYDDGVTERVRYTKTREVHDFDGPNGKMSVWNKIWRR